MPLSKGLGGDGERNRQRFRQEVGEGPGRFRQTERADTVKERGLSTSEKKGHRLESPAYPFALHASVSLGFKGINESPKVTRLL